MVKKLIQIIKSQMETSLQYVVTYLQQRLVPAIIGLTWAWIEPTLPFLWICGFALFVDCITAWRLNRRIRKRYSREVADGKLKSTKLSKKMSDLGIILLCIMLADHIESDTLTHLGTLHFAEYVAAAFCVVQFVSILENESSCNGSTWAILLQKVLADKTERHIKLSAEEFEKLRAEQEEKESKKENSKKNKKKKFLC